MKSEDTTKVLINALNKMREKSESAVSDTKNATVDMMQVTIDVLKGEEDILSGLDGIIDTVENPVDLEVFKDFIKYRDLTRDIIRVLKMRVSADKEYVDVLNAFQLWATQK